MKLSASNIAWNEKDDHAVFAKLLQLGFKGIEIAPTRIVKENPYASENRTRAIEFSKNLENTWGLKISSMQSLLYGVTENIFGTAEERKRLADYIYKAIEFAADVQCPHLVFGCPRNRNLNDDSQRHIGIDFFSKCAFHAEKHGVTIGLEANPSIYGTNYLNTTEEAVRTVRQVNHPSLKLNYDLGADLINRGELSNISEIIDITSHVHISDPMLGPVAYREQHLDLAKQLYAANYSHWISLEMKDAGIVNLDNALAVLSKTFT